MQCEQFEWRWQQLTDERRPWDSDPHLVAHSLRCEKCATHAALGDQLLLGLDLDDQPGLPSDFAERVVAVLSAETAGGDTNAASSGGWAAVWSCVAVLAASLALVISLLPPPTAPTPSAAPAFSALTPGGALPGVSAPPSELGGPQLELDSPFVADTKELTEIAGRFAHQQAAKVIQHLDNVARPITTSVGAAFTAIYRSIPVPAKPEKSAELLLERTPLA
jgi:hypothetical protein